MNARQRRVAIRQAVRLNERAYGRTLTKQERWRITQGSWMVSDIIRVRRHSPHPSRHQFPSRKTNLQRWLYS